MKELIITIAAFATLAATVPVKNSENHLPDDKPEWTLVPDDNGHFEYIDTKAYYNQPEALIFKRYNATSDIIFRLFTRNNPTEPQNIYFENTTSLINSQFNAAHPTRFIIHGWINNGESKMNNIIKTAYINRAEYNVIIVDWGIGASTVNYISARNRINRTGQHVARFIDWINKVSGISFTTISIVGHSLGAHMAGVVGKLVTRGRLEAIYALDPAKPLFSMDRPYERVASTDANYVEVIHTNAGRLGFDQPIGIADFYPNWGNSQPKCKFDATGMCSHGRAYEYFAHSINNAESFVGTQCANYAEILNQQCTSSGPTRNMGEHRNGPASGVYFVETNATLKMKACGILIIFLIRISFLNVTNLS